MQATTRIHLAVFFAAAAIIVAPESAFAQTSAPAPRSEMPMGMGGQSGQAGMMDSDMAQMMSMMRSMMTMMSARSGMMASHVEGRIASLKTDLKITEKQLPQWNAFADALRAAAKSMNGATRPMMQTDTPATLPARLAGQEKMLTAHLAALKALKEALDPLYASFSDDQKKIADGLMVGPMGMM